MSIYRGSRYTKTALYDKDRKGKLILELRQKEKFDLSDATYYTVIEGDTIDGIAYKLYNNAQLYWAIMDANPIYLSETDIKPGDVIVIPSYSEVVRFIG